MPAPQACPNCSRAHGLADACVYLRYPGIHAAVETEPQAVVRSASPVPARPAPAAGVGRRVRVDDVVAWHRTPFVPLEGRLCPLGWKPNIWQPVFYGIHDVGPSDGAPMRIRIIYPSVDGAVWSAPILEDCGLFPIVLFAHGQCADVDHYRSWTPPLVPLARSGYVVVMPDMNYGSNPFESTGQLLQALGWAIFEWSHASLLAPSIGVAGHSYGALATAGLGAETSIANVYASLGGGFAEFHGEAGDRLRAVDVPALLMAGTDDFFVFEGQTGQPVGWKQVGPFKHSVVFEGGDHWDYLPPGFECQNGLRGPCEASWILASDILLTFFSKYMPPTPLPQSLGLSLNPPTADDVLALNPTAAQQFFLGGHLLGKTFLASAHAPSWAQWLLDGGPFARSLARLLLNPSCVLRLAWDTPIESGLIELF